MFLSGNKNILDIYSDYKVIEHVCECDNYQMHQRGLRKCV